MARDPNLAERSKEKIMQAAISEFSEAGYYQAKISNIVAKAEFSQRTFYIYFNNKEAIYREILDNWKNNLIDLFTIEKSNPNYRNVIQKRWEGIFKFMLEHSECTKAVYLQNPFIEEVRQDLFAPLKQIMTWEQENGFVKKNLCVDLLVESHLATFESIAIRHLLNGKKDYAFLAKQLSEMYVDGVAI